MTGIRRVSQLGTTGESTYVDGSIQAVDIAANVITQAKLSTDISLSGFRNKIINGGFDVWQRGTNYTTAGGGYGSADRWYSGFATGSFTIQSFTLGNGITGYEPQYFGRWTISSNSQNYELIQKLEGVRSFAGQEITISFWARQTSGSVSVNGRWVQHFGTGGSPSSSVVTNFAVPLTVTGSWVRYQYTMTVPSISGKTIGTANDDSCWLSFQVVNTATGSLDFWGVQVESGSQATPFEQRPIGVEEFLCKRYYQKWSNSSNTSFMTIGSSMYSTPLTLSVPMRTVNNTSVTYVATIYGNGTSYAINSLGVSIFDTANPQYFRLEGSFSGSWNYSWPLCTFNTHNVIINSEL